MIPKITLLNTASVYSATAINENFSRIAEHMNNLILYRNNPVGTDNFMRNALDMNSNDILNVRDLTILGDLKVWGYSLRELFRKMKEFLERAEEAAERAENAADRAENAENSAADAADRAEESASQAAYWAALAKFFAQESEKWALYAWQAASQVSGGMRVAIAEGDVNDFRADFFDPILYLTTDTLPVMVRAPGANTEEEVFFQANETEKKPILLPSGEKPVKGDIQGETLLQWNLQKDAWILLNKQSGERNKPFQIGGVANANSTGNYLEVEMPEPITELLPYMTIVVNCTREAGNTGTVSMKVDGTLQKFVVRTDGSALGVEDIPERFLGLFTYWPSLDSWVLINPHRANYARFAENAAEATHALNADNAINSQNAVNAQRAENADYATNSGTANYATNAGHATTADSITGGGSGAVFAGAYVANRQLIHGVNISSFQYGTTGSLRAIWFNLATSAPANGTNPRLAISGIPGQNIDTLQLITSSATLGSTTTGRIVFAPETGTAANYCGFVAAN